MITKGLIMDLAEKLQCKCYVSYIKMNKYVYILKTLRSIQMFL